MEVQMTPFEAELLIAVLTGAEGVFAHYQQHEMSEALTELRPWRSALLAAYMRSRMESLQAAGAVDPVGELAERQPTTREA